MLEHSKLDEGTDPEGYFAGLKPEPTHVAAKDGTIVAPTRANPEHAPKRPVMRLEVPSFDDDESSSKKLKKSLDKWEIELTTANRNTILLLGGFALFLGIGAALLSRYLNEKKNQANASSPRSYKVGRKTQKQLD